MTLDPALKDEDEKTLARYKEENPWGMALAIDLHDCAPEIIRDEKHISNFVDALIKVLKMKAYGKVHIMDFGANPKVSGFSMFQFIETSAIAGHFVNLTNSAYLDIFSCKPYRPHETALFCKKYFKAQNMKVHKPLFRI